MKRENGNLLKDIRLDKELYQIPYKPIFFTLVANYKKCYFINPEINEQIIECLEEIFQTSNIFLPVYCLMPDHLHFVSYATGQEGNLLDRVNYFKSKTSKIGKNFGISDLWQKRYYDHIVREQESLRKISEYIYDNPVRKKLIEYAGDYPYRKINYELLDI